MFRDFFIFAVMALIYSVVGSIVKNIKLWAYQNAWLKNGADDGRIKELGNVKGSLATNFFRV